MPESTVFDKDWLACQEENYKQVIRSSNANRRAEAQSVLEELGYSKAEISTLYIEATLHIDDMPDDFIPDMDMIEQQRQQAEKPHALECTCPSCIPAPPRYRRESDPHS